MRFNGGGPAILEPDSQNVKALSEFISPDRGLSHNGIYIAHVIAG